MGAGFGSWLLALLAIFFAAAASSSGQHILIGEFHQWSFVSPETLVSVALALMCGGLSNKLRIIRERRTQKKRDGEAEETLRQVENMPSDRLSDVTAKTDRPAFSIGDWVTLLSYACFSLITMVFGIGFPLIGILALAMIIAFVCAFFPTKRYVFRWVGGAAMVMHVYFGFMILLLEDDPHSVFGDIRINPLWGYLGPIYLFISAATAWSILRARWAKW